MAINPLFIEMIEGYGSDLLDGLVDSLSGSDPSVSIRLNRSKGFYAPNGAKRVPWAERGYYLDERPKFTLDPAIHQGRYYVQEASSMILGEIIKQLTEGENKPLRYLDACAAPGGKTTAAIDALPAGSLVVANEYVPKRANILAENISKWGYPSVVVSRGDTRRLSRLKGFFDIVAVDAPCSGEGMFRKEPEAVEQWTPALVRECAERQEEILGNVWSALAPGGYLVYSTCTFNRHENEEMVAWLVNEMGSEPITMKFPDDWCISNGINTEHPCYRFLPHKLRGEGLFVAVLKKPEGGSRFKVKPAKQAKIDKSIEPLRSWLKNGEQYLLIKEENMISAFPLCHADVLNALKEALDIVACGTVLAEIKGKDLIPTQSLAMSTALNPDIFPQMEVDRETALNYLRREAIALPDGTARGYILLTYANYPLGFVKNLGNRANNLYPAHWRILMK